MVQYVLYLAVLCLLYCMYCTVQCSASNAGVIKDIGSMLTAQYRLWTSKIREEMVRYNKTLDGKVDKHMQRQTKEGDVRLRYYIFLQCIQYTVHPILSSPILCS